MLSQWGFEACAEEAFLGGGSSRPRCGACSIPVPRVVSVVIDTVLYRRERGFISYGGLY